MLLRVPLQNSAWMPVRCRRLAWALEKDARKMPEKILLTPGITKTGFFKTSWTYKSATPASLLPRWQHLAKLCTEKVKRAQISLMILSRRPNFPCKKLLFCFFGVGEPR
eukprot:COSAG06_NODE_502_length_14953_cov_15.585297_7_plen_109_part_00